MSKEDIEFAVSITSPMDWNLGQADFEFMMELEPEGCFILLADSKRVGLVTNVSFGKTAWFGNLIVEDSYRKSGGGSLLVKHSIDYLEKSGVRTVALYAYLERMQFYTRLGFTEDSRFLVMSGKAPRISAPSEISKVSANDLPKILSFDEKCFGESRKKSLEPILLDPDNLCYCQLEKGSVIGYAAAKVFPGGAELGPLMCSGDRSDVAVRLLQTLLAELTEQEVYAIVPKTGTAILDAMRGYGFTESLEVARMYHGGPLRDACISAAESLERG